MNMKFHRTLQRTAAATSAIAVLTMGGIASAAATTTAATTTDTTTPSSSTATPLTAAEQARVQAIIAKGDQEITRRQTSLSTLTTKITEATKLTSTDKTTLANEISAEVTGLTNLKTKLDAETTLAGVKADAASIVTDYRVYALIVPKVALVKAADDQQVTEAKLTALSTKLQTRITAGLTAGKNVAALQTQLTDLTAKVAAAQAVSSAIETKVAVLQPDDYNTDHTILSGDAAQLKTAHANNLAAVADAKAIIAGLKTLQ